MVFCDPGIFFTGVPSSAILNFFFLLKNWAWKFSRLKSVVVKNFFGASRNVAPQGFPDFPPLLP